MPITIGDIIRVILCQNVAQKEVCMIFSYVVDLLTGTILISEVADEFEDAIVPEINVLQNAGVLNSEVKVENLTDGVSFYNKTITGQGAKSTGLVANFEALGFRYDRATKVTRNGYKRVPGIDLTYEDTANAWDLSNTDIDTLAGVLANSLNVPSFSMIGSAELRPIILGTDPTGQPDLNRFQRVATVTPRLWKSSQVSRKVG